MYEPVITAQCGKVVVETDPGEGAEKGCWSLKLGVWLSLWEGPWASGRWRERMQRLGIIPDLVDLPWTSTSPSTSPLPHPPHPSLLPPEYPLSMPTPYRSLLVSIPVSSPRSPPLPRQTSTLTKKTAFKNRIDYRAKLLWRLALSQGRMLSQKLLLNFLLLRNRVCRPACFSHYLKKRNVSHWTSQREASSAPAWLQVKTLLCPPSPTHPLMGEGSLAALARFASRSRRPVAHSPLARSSPRPCTI